MKTFLFLRIACVLACLHLVARADVALPPNLLDPPTAAEAWNVLGLVTANVERLLKEERLSEIPVQVSICSPALRRLALETKPPERATALKAESTLGLSAVNDIAVAAGAKDLAATAKALDAFREITAKMATHFDPTIVATEISICPMHPECVAPNPTTPCEKCGMAMIKRRIPYSFIYVPPGEPTLLLKANASAPLSGGKKADVKVKILRRDGTPVLLKDLLVMHTEPIHLLIIDPSLTDYHHEHPVPTDVPGEYAFSFTPQKNATYRIYADVVPADSGVQEYPAVELPGTAPADPLGDMSGVFQAKAGGYNFRLTFENGQLPRAKQIRNMIIEITNPDGTPTRQLQPVMNAFCHLVGFYEDNRTVVHLHPEGGDVTRDDVRGGPTLGFRFFPPRPGFMRVFCQVLIDGKMIFAPFNVNIAP